MQHARLINRLVSLWLLCYAGLAWAAPSLAQDVRALDFESVLWAAAAGALGGALRTILTLASSQTAVYDIWREAVKDLIVSLLAGLGAYIIVQGVGSGLTTYLKLSDVPRDLRLLIIVGAGWTRMGFFGKMDRLTKAAMVRAEKQITGANEMAPSSERMPLEK